MARENVDQTRARLPPIESVRAINFPTNQTPWIFLFKKRMPDAESKWSGRSSAVETTMNDCMLCNPIGNISFEALKDVDADSAQKKNRKSRRRRKQKNESINAFSLS